MFKLGIIKLKILMFKLLETNGFSSYFYVILYIEFFSWKDVDSDLI